MYKYDYITSCMPLIVAKTKKNQQNEIVKKLNYEKNSSVASGNHTNTFL